MSSNKKQNDQKTEDLAKNSPLSDETVNTEGQGNQPGKEQSNVTLPEDLAATESKVVNDQPAVDAQNAQVIAQNFDRRGPSMMETTMSAASAAGRPAQDALAATQGIVITKEDQHAAAAIAAATDEQVDSAPAEQPE